ncbi:MAG: type II toxin-antitoxin system VapC family toxin [Patescibacteria group bacterium]
MVIIDTSIVFKWFAEQEVNHKLALKLLEKYLSGEEEITIPDLLLYELTNAWSTKTGLDLIQITKNLVKLEAYTLPMVSVSFALLKYASHFARVHQVSVYDAVYAVLADDFGCNLITADERFVTRVNLPFVKLLGK